MKYLLKNGTIIVGIRIVYSFHVSWIASVSIALSLQI